jgi:hypothetical protein
MHVQTVFLMINPWCSKHVHVGDAKNLINPLNAELNPICRLLALLGAHRILHVSEIRVKALN